MAGGSVPAEVMSVVNACNNLAHWALMEFTDDYADDGTDDIADALVPLVDALGVLMTPQDVLTIVLDESVVVMGDEAVSDVVSAYVVTP